MIYFKKAETATTFQDLIILGYTLLIGDLYHKFTETFYDEACTMLQCKPARRSFYDLYEIATTYFPATTKEQLADFLLNSNMFAYFICPDIEKLVFPANSTLRPYRIDAASVNYIGKDNLSYKDVLALAQNNK